MPAFTWDVQIPGQDLMQQVTTDYIVSDGEELTIDGRLWIVERVELAEDGDGITGVVSVIPQR